MTEDPKPQITAEYALLQAAARLHDRATKYSSATFSLRVSLLAEVVDDLEGRVTAPVLNKAISRTGQAGMNLMANDDDREDHIAEGRNDPQHRRWIEVDALRAELDALKTGISALRAGLREACDLVDECYDPAALPCGEDTDEIPQRVAQLRRLARRRHGR